VRSWRYLLPRGQTSAPASFVSGTLKSLEIHHLRQRCNHRIRSQKLLGRWIDRGREGGRLVDAEGAIGPVAHNGRARFVAGNKMCIIINEYFY